MYTLWTAGLGKRAWIKAKLFMMDDITDSNGLEEYGLEYAQMVSPVEQSEAAFGVIRFA